ncbi:Coiled-coil domain-containing protein 42 [Tetrabaena socialis]|uniref:Coiled-coil domain-containing protein 42 n=1 Tax=Tetrabaena socialis TaxID=47790 RepID=A0A2J8A458_9CHLO|nr:Coiled-coil domain-containing protein 42 [Tetrabaena socialis]|eukprot:PNH07304.1 Coiled-coil domain-containing protein 42 [Tetrabaena socialis]
MQMHARGPGLSRWPCRMLPQTLVLDHVSPATRLLEKRRQMFEVQEALEAQKQDFNRKEEVFKRREEALKLKDLELQESLIRFSKFLQENDSKRARAEKKAADEIKARLQKEKEIEQLTEVLEELKAEKERILEVLEKNMRWVETRAWAGRRHARKIASQRTLEYGQVVLSADNIFNRCRGKSSIGHPAESNPLHQLDVIGNFVSDLGAIIKHYKVSGLRSSTARAED